MSDPLNVALIGQKFMGRAHANAWGQAPRFFNLPRRPRLVTVAARAEGELAHFAERWEIPEWTTDWRTIASDERIDLVDVGTPNDVHAEQSIAMLEAGKHVACEKPLAGTLAEARLMRDAAAAAAGKTYCWFNYRRCPAVALARQLVQEGRLGRIFHVRAAYLQSWGGRETPLLWRFKKERAGSGAHGDLNAHIVDMARFILADDVTEVAGAIAKTFIEERPLPDDPSRTGESDVDDCVLFLARFGNGAVASFEATRLATGHLNRNTIEVNGESGAIRFDFENMNVLEFFDANDGPREGGWRRIMCTSAGHHPWIDAWWPDAHVIGYEHGFVNMAADIVNDLCGREPVVPLPDFADAYETQRVLEAAMIAASERIAVPMDQVR